MRAPVLGALRDRVALDRPVLDADGVREGWTEAALLPARILYLKGGETVQAARLAGRQPAVVTVRAAGAPAGLSPEWRLRDPRRGVVYQLRAVVPAPDPAWLELTVESGTAG